MKAVFECKRCGVKDPVNKNRLFFWQWPKICKKCREESLKHEKFYKED